MNSLIDCLTTMFSIHRFKNILYLSIWFTYLLISILYLSNTIYIICDLVIYNIILFSFELENSFINLIYVQFQ